MPVRDIEETGQAQGSRGEAENRRWRLRKVCNRRRFVRARGRTVCMLFMFTIDVARTSFASNFSQPMSEFVAQKIFCVEMLKKKMQK
jgi:hypothetical protein